MLNPDKGTKKRVLDSDEEEGAQEGGMSSGEKKAISFREWEPLLFQASIDFLLALINIKTGSFPSPLTTGDWTKIEQVRERTQFPYYAWLLAPASDHVTPLA